MKQWPLVLLWPDVFGAGKRQSNPEGWWHRLVAQAFQPVPDAGRGRPAYIGHGGAVPLPAFHPSGFASHCWWLVAQALQPVPDAGRGRPA